VIGSDADPASRNDRTAGRARSSLPPRCGSSWVLIVLRAGWPPADTIEVIFNAGQFSSPPRS